MLTQTPFIEAINHVAHLTIHFRYAARAQTGNQIRALRDDIAVPGAVATRWRGGFRDRFEAIRDSRIDRSGQRRVSHVATILQIAPFYWRIDYLGAGNSQRLSVIYR